MTKRGSAAGIGLILLACGGAYAQEPQHPRVMPAQAFVSAIGINTHLSAFWMSYGPLTKNATDPQLILDQLRYLSISLIRDGMPTADTTPKAIAIMSELGTLADAGIRLDLLAAFPQDISKLVAGTEQLENEHRAAVASIEGPNEVTDNGFDYAGASGGAGVMKYQTALTAAVRASPNLSRIPIYNFSLLDTVHEPGRVFGTKIPAEFINVHAYASQPSLIAQRISIARQMGPKAKFVVTEGGFYTNPDPKAWGSVSQPVQAKLLLNWLMDVAEQGAHRTFIYELLDNTQDKPGTYSPENHFGLYDVSGKPKAAAAALHNLTRILGRSEDAVEAAGGGAEDKLPTGRRERRRDRSLQDAADDALPCTIDGLPPTGNTLLLSKGHGVYDLVVWGDQTIWDRVTLSEIAPPPASATVHLHKGFRAKAVFDPMTGDAPKPMNAASADVTLRLGGSPLILEIAPGRLAKGAK